MIHTQKPHAGDGPQPDLKRGRRFIREVWQTLLMVIAVYTLLTLALPRYMVEGSSMEPNFHDGQRLFVSRLDYMVSKPQRGDVVVIRNPNNANGEDLIKRVVGLPGETIRIDQGQVYIDGIPLPENNYIKDKLRASREKSWDLTVDQYFVMGDNRNNSNDSYDFGPVSREHIVGRAWIAYWPPEWLGIIPYQDYPDSLSP